eukprot:8086490-Pyramimonas_sp.AAC.1
MDRLALEEEARSWDATLKQARAAHATTWRLLRAQPHRPGVVWTPAHKELDDYLQHGIHLAMHA